MLPVKIDISQLVSGYDLSNSEVEDFSRTLVERMASRFVRDLTVAAKAKLRSTRAEYVNSIVVNKERYNIATVELMGVVPNMVEQGASPFDMKVGFEKSSKKTTKLDGGWYLTIPFQHAISGSVGEQFSSVMPDNVTNEARKLKPKESMTMGKLPESAQGKGFRPKIVMESKAFAEYKHKSAKYEGLTKSQKKGHSGYTTFRRVSDKSDDDSWIHTGMPAMRLFDVAFKDESILHEVDLTRDEFFAKLGI